MFTRRFLPLLLTAFQLLLLGPAIGPPAAIAEESPPGKVFRAGAYAIDVTPPEFPVIVNGGMTERRLEKAIDALHARCLVLDDGRMQIAIVVVDNCMMPRDLLDDVKRMASEATGIPPERMLISATHTHTAPSVHGCLGSDVDEKYRAFLGPKIARGIQLAQENLAPARVGWGVEKEPKNVFCRRFLMKEGTARSVRFTGHENDRAMMNPGHENENIVEATGVPDQDVTVVSFQSPEGRPIGMLANYSTHYAGVGGGVVSADYFGVFCERIGKLIEAEGGGQHPPFMAIMSNGTSGDANCNNYTRPRRVYDHHSVAEDAAQAALRAYRRIEYHDWLPLEMEEALLPLDVRMPSAEEAAAAREFLAQFDGRKPQTIDEVYAREAVLLSKLPPSRELKLQAIRIGGLGIAAIPNEVYSATGLAIKKESPFETTFTIELANGCEGYIPTPEQHPLGGYTTWRARTSCLEVEAEAKIRRRALELLKEVHRPER